jgi:hypothetical protein
MFRHLIRSAPAAVAALAALATLATTAPAQAVVKDPVLAPEWTTAPCATGSLLKAGWDPHGSVTVSGEAKLCATAPVNAAFAVAVYHLNNEAAEPFAEMEDARYYAGKGTRPFTADVRFITPGKEAICLVAGPKHRLACAVLYVSDRGAVSMVPVHVDEPIFMRPAKFGREDPNGPVGPKPTCATCF